MVLGTTHTARLASPPRDPNQVPPGDLEDAVGTHEENDFNEADGDEDEDVESMDDSDED